VVYRPAFSLSRIIESTARVNILHHITGQVQRFRKSGIIFSFTWLIFRKEVYYEKKLAVLIAYACMFVCSFSMLSGCCTGTGTRTKTSTRAASRCPAAATATIAVTTVILITVMPLITP